MTKKIVSGRTWGGWDWLGLMVVCLIAWLIALPNIGNYGSHKPKEAEVKQNLHNIQLALERFAVDTEGAYPHYLIGGSPAQSSGIPNTVAYSSDVLIRKGYITSYPRNPFIRNSESLLELQADHPKSITGSDPLRPGDPEGDTLGYRFGAEGRLMGQVLCDPRYEKWLFTDPLSGEVERRDTWAIIEYPFWDMWKGNRPLMYLPGMFFYKGIGPVIAYAGTEENSESDDQQGGNEHLSLDGDLVGPTGIVPMEIDQYMLGGYGSIRTKGKDVLGDEKLFEGWYLKRSPHNEDNSYNYEVIQFQSTTWTRSAYSATDLGGSPFINFAAGESNEQLLYGNPNGIRDGLIIVLTAGEDYIGNR